jgi:hypothetical protein
MIQIGAAIIGVLDEQFARLHACSVEMVKRIPAERLYWQARPARGVGSVCSVGEHLIHSAAIVERTFGGITSNLWDDPFEWTLPETLASPIDLLEYVSEVEATRRRGFATLNRDDDLLKRISNASGELQTLFDLIVDTLVRAASQQGSAQALFALLPEEVSRNKTLNSGADLSQ